MSAIVSIIIPTYNRATLLKRAIESVQNQTYTNWELLIIDDGSTDDTHSVVSTFIKNDIRIRLFTIPHSGRPAEPRNKGLQQARGTYIAFLDSDDTWHKEKLKKQLTCFDQNPETGIVSCYVDIINNKTNKRMKQHQTLYRGTVLSKLLFNNFLLTASTLMIRRDVLTSVGIFDSQFKVTEDWDLCIRIAQADYLFDYVPQALVSYYIHESNIYIGNATFNGTEEFAQLLTKHLALLKNNDSPTLGYYYFLQKQFRQARPYLLKMLFKQNVSIRTRIKLAACLIVTFCPRLLPIAEKSWRLIRRVLVFNT